MKGFIKTWWHCIFRISKSKDHRVCHVNWTSGKWEWKCSCELSEYFIN